MNSAISLSSEDAMPTDAERIAGVRRFNRFYTGRIGVLRDGLLGSEFSLTEARVLYEIATREHAVASELAAALDIDPGYLSRMLRRFRAARLVTGRRSPTDGRREVLTLTAAGRAAFATLDRRSQQEVGALLDRLDASAQGRLLAAMATIEAVLGVPAHEAPVVVLRPHRAGDLGWVLARHAALYAQEYGWGAAFETLVAGIVADFLKSFDPAREACWIAERDGVPAGSAMLVRADDGVARLRLLLVEPQARGLGIGRRLVEACVAFARSAGYRKITLWTQSTLVEARAIYERTGFVCVAQETHRSFGIDLIGETWERDL
jgi:DNA-binding MarR family transcriptional regulator/ribosomal protein S18 acetylase RimI-like enzyme